MRYGFDWALVWVNVARTLGDRSITTRDADVALDGNAPLDVDAIEFAEAIESRDFARAVDLYDGPFLEGFHVDESPAFDQWASRERRRLESMFIKACAEHCATLARSRRWSECETVAARWLDTEPLSADAAIYLLNAIKSPGTRSTLIEGWSRTAVELAKTRMALNRPRDAITTLRTAYATRLAAMGRYVPISELDFWMSQAFAQAGEADSARVYRAYVDEALKSAEPETRARPGQPPLPEADCNLIMHITLPILGGHHIMGTDAPESMGFKLNQGNSVYINLEPDTRGETDRLFNALAEGGTVEMQLAEQFWGDYYGSLKDKFGTQWMFNCRGNT